MIRYPWHFCVQNILTTTSYLYTIRINIYNIEEVNDDTTKDTRRISIHELMNGDTLTEKELWLIKKISSKTETCCAEQGDYVINTVCKAGKSRSTPPARKE